jgi:hypothetical protein
VSASNDELLQLVTDCEEREGRLSDWERGFVSNIRSTLEAGRSLTEKQTERLDEVWEKATAKG